jgi:hypothetical protein
MPKGHYYLIAIFSILFFASLLTPLAHASTTEQIIIQQTQMNSSLGPPLAQIIYVNGSYILTGFKIYLYVSYKIPDFKGVYYGVGKITNLNDLNHSYSILYTNTWNLDTNILANNTYTWIRFNCSVRAREGYYFLWVRPIGTTLSFLVKTHSGNLYPNGYAVLFYDTASTPYFKSTQNDTHDWTMYVFGIPYTDPTTIVLEFLPALLTIAMLGVAIGLMSRSLKY